MAFQVLLVDDHKIMRDGIKAILRHNSDEFAVFGEAESGTEAVQMCRKKRPDIILMDIGLPGLNGIETTTEILRHCPDVKIIILSMYDDEHSVVSAIRSGARAFVLKKASDNDLLDALRAVAKGGSYLSPQVSDRLLHRIQRGDLESKPASSALDEEFREELVGGPFNEVAAVDGTATALVFGARLEKESPRRRPLVVEPDCQLSLF